MAQGLSTRLANLFTGGDYSRRLTEAEIGQMGQSFFRERYWELESALSANAEGVLAVVGNDEPDFSRGALRIMHRQAMLYYLKNPLIRRGVRVQSHYIFAQGVTVNLPDDASKAAFDLFWDDEDNRREWSSATRLATLDRKLQIKGNLFALFFIDRVMGTCQVREIDVDEIEEILPDPDDATRPAFYKRVTRRRMFNARNGTYAVTAEETIEFYPDWHYTPATRPATIGGKTVHWDQPMAHFTRDQFGKCAIAPSEIFSVLDWSRGYTRFLETRLTVAAALSRIVMKITNATKNGAANAKRALMSRFAEAKQTPGTGDDVGGTAFQTPGQNIEAVNVKGATIHPDEGRAQKLMVCAGFGFGETFFGDVSVGTLATATSLERPTELAMMECQVFWKEVLGQMASFVLLQAAKAPASAYSKAAKVGKSATNGRGREWVLYRDADGVYRPLSPDVDFPPLLHHEIDLQMNAVTAAAQLVPLKKLIARHALSALGEDDPDEALALLPDDEKLTEWPAAPQVTPVMVPPPNAPPQAAPPPAKGK